MAGYRRKKDDFQFDLIKIKPNTDISGIKMVDRRCPCGAIFRVMAKSKQKNHSRLCAELPVVTSFYLPSDQKAKVDRHFDMDDK